MKVNKIFNGINHLHSFNELKGSKKKKKKEKLKATGWVKKANSQHGHAFSCYVVCKAATNKCWIEDEKRNLYNIEK